MIQTLGNQTLSLQPVRQIPTISASSRPVAVQPKALAKDSLDLKSLGVGTLTGAGTVYLPLVAGGYSLETPFRANLADSLKAPLVEKSTLAMIGGAALAGGIAGSIAGRNTRNSKEALTTGAMVGMTVGALSGAAVAVATKTMTPVQGAMRGAMMGGFAGGAGGAGAYLLGSGE